MPAPAIRTKYKEKHRDIDVIETVGSDTRYQRGLGDLGTVVYLVDMESIGGCPRCGEREMVMSQDLNPGGYDNCAFYCTHLRCPHFVSDEVEYDMSRIRADTPHVWDNTAECPDCDSRHTVEIERHSVLHSKAEEGSSCIVEVVCDDCQAQLREEASA